MAKKPLPTYYYWCRQLYCALQALELLHENKLVCGSMCEDSIYCTLDSADGKLLPLHLAPDGSRHNKVQYMDNYDPISVQNSYFDDAIAAAYTYV